MFKGQSSKICRHVSNWRPHGTSDWILNNRWGGDCLIDNRLSNVYFVGYFTNNISNELGASYWNDHFINFFFMYNSQIQLDISSWYMCNVNVGIFDIFILSHGHGWVYCRHHFWFWFESDGMSWCRQAAVWQSSSLGWAVLHHKRDGDPDPGLGPPPPPPPGSWRGTSFTLPLGTRATRLQFLLVCTHNVYLNSYIISTL